MDYLKGKKTYLVTVAGMLVTGAWMMGWIDDETANKILVLFGFGAGVTLRAGMKG